jgi:hypothetical protein
MRRNLLVRCAFILCLASAGWSWSRAAAARMMPAAKHESVVALGLFERSGETQRGTLRCSPRRLYRGDTLTLEMPERHGGYLAVVNPRGDYLFLTSDQAETKESERKAGVHPLMSTTEFGGMRQLKLSTNDTRALDYNKKGLRGGRRAAAVFQQTGWYKVMLGQTSFEQEDPPFDAMCRVYYVNRR